MKTRNVIRNEDGTYNIVWFGSSGLEPIEDPTPEEVTIYSITRDNFLCNEFPIAVCGLTSVVDDGNGNITSITITTSYERLKKQLVTLEIELEKNNTDCEIEYTFKDSNNTILATGYYFNSFEQQFTFSMNDKSIITLILVLDNGTNIAKIENLKLTYSGISGNKIAANNYLQDSSEMVAKSLIPRLALIKGELWYDLNYGYPLLDKIKDKAVFDIWTMKVINNHPYVADISSYQSSIKNREYSYDVNVTTIYGNTTNISSK